MKSAAFHNHISMLRTRAFQQNSLLHFSLHVEASSSNARQPIKCVHYLFDQQRAFIFGAKFQGPMGSHLFTKDSSTWSSNLKLATLQFFYIIFAFVAQPLISILCFLSFNVSLFSFVIGSDFPFHLFRSDVQAGEFQQAAELPKCAFIH